MFSVSWLSWLSWRTGLPPAPGGRGAPLALWALLMGVLAALVGVVVMVVGVPVAHADSTPPGGLDQMTSAVAIRNGSTTDFHAGDQVLVTVAGWRDASGSGPEAIVLVAWRAAHLSGQGGAVPPVPLGYVVASWEDPMTFTLHLTLPRDVTAGLYYVEVRGVTTSAQTQPFYLTPPITASAQRQRETARWVSRLAPGGLADAGAVGLLATLSAGVLLLLAGALQVVGFRRRRTLRSRHA